MVLEADGYRSIDADTGQRAIEEVRTRNPDLVLLDLGLPDVDGLALVPVVRANSAAPIIVVSGRTADTDKVRALDAGADDYLTKPFSVLELRARVRATLRNHTRVFAGTASMVGFGPYVFNFAERSLVRGRDKVHLSPTEFRLLGSLARRPDRLVGTDVLLRETWGPAYQDKYAYVRVYMHALRKKLELDPARPEYILNESGLGYRLITSTSFWGGAAGH
jgi:two-component system KDP operon response regulator KdpE